MNPLGESAILIVIAIILLIHIGGNLLRVKKKYEFVSFLKKERQTMMTEGLATLSDEDIVFESMPHCVFDNESNGLDDTLERYGELYRLYRHKTYYILLHFLYTEKEDKVVENLEVSELTPVEKEAFIEKHKFSFKKIWEKEKIEFSARMKEIQNGKLLKKSTKRK